MRMQHASVTLNRSFECMPKYTKQNTKKKNIQQHTEKLKQKQKMRQTFI